MTLTDFVLARIAERERGARAALGDVIGAEGETHGSWGAFGDAVMANAPGEYVWIVTQDPGIGDTAVAAHIARWDPAAVLARCAVDRQIVALHNRDHECSTFDHDGDFDTCTWVSGGDCSTMRLMASLDVDHPDYDEDWKP